MKQSAIAILVLMSAVAAKNIDLSTVPPRDGVQLTIYNSEDLTLVRETRTISLKKGVNPLQFSWANTLIDPSSVELQFKTNADRLEVLDTTFPHDKPQMLYWNVRSEFEGEAVVRISYFTSGITWAADYSGAADKDETGMSFDGFVRIFNRSGDDYVDAEIRLVVGTINLVERIDELARRGQIDKDDAERFRRGDRKLLSQKAGRAFHDELAAVAEGAAAQPKAIIKEGLSEYFVFTVPGTETVRNNWSKRMRLFHGVDVPLTVQYRYRPAEYGEQLVRMVLLRNDQKRQLGETPLPDGVVRLYRDNGMNGQSFLLQQQIQYVPIGQEIELNLGPDPEVIYERIRTASRRENFWFRRSGVGVYFSPDQGHRVEINDSVAGWDDHESWVERIRNYRDRPIAVELRRSFSGDVAFRSRLDPVLHDFRTPQFTTTLAAGEKRELGYDLVIAQGRNHTQDRVRLETLP